MGKDIKCLIEIATKYDNVYDPNNSEFSADLSNLFNIAYKQGYEEGLEVAQKLLEDLKEQE